MNLQLLSMDDVTVVELSGNVDTYTSPQVRQALDNVINRQSAHLVVDLNQVTFMDSSALAVLVQGMKKCRERGGDLRLCGPQKPVRMILELTRLDQALEIYVQRAEAVYSFARVSA
ncbi:MAG: STAS domain-containing protein [Caldilineaceae bacterium]